MKKITVSNPPCSSLHVILVKAINYVTYFLNSLIIQKDERCSNNRIRSDKSEEYWSKRKPESSFIL